MFMQNFIQLMQRFMSYRVNRVLTFDDAGKQYCRRSTPFIVYHRPKHDATFLK